MIRQRPAAADAPSPVIRESRRTATHGTPALAPRLTRARGPERPLRLAGVYGQPGEAGLDSLARLLLTLAADSESPHTTPDRRLLLPAEQQGPA